MFAEHGVGNRRAAWRIIASEKQKENFEGNGKFATYETEYVVKVEADFPEVRDNILTVMNKNLVPSDSTGESPVLCFNLKGD